MDLAASSTLMKALMSLLLISFFVISENLMGTTKEFNLKNQIYKVLTLDEWEQAQTSGLISTELDKEDGFVHLSTATQLNATLALYFDKLDSIVLLQIDESQTHEQIKFEGPIPPGNRSGLFPHYYGDLDIKSISRIWHLSRGAFEIPIEVMLQAEDNSNS